MTRRRLTKLVLVLVALSTSACGLGFKATAPAGFVKLDSEYTDYDFRATNADGLVMGVRELEHDPKGEAAFWLKAIKNKMRTQAGYALLGEEAVTTSSGLKGTQLRFGHDQDGNNPHLYFITLIVTPKKLFLLEAGGTKKLMTENKAKVNAAIQAFRLN